MLHLPRFMLAAPSSGSGKTMLTCGILQALKNRGCAPASYKCGPDYIDPMFHSRVLGTPSRNLDTFFTGEETTRYLFARSAKHAGISVMEGVMGLYDGVGGITDQASAYDLARVTDTPVILIVNAKGMSAGKITGIISENTDIFVLPDQNRGDTTNPKEGFSCRSSKETYTCIIIFISTFQRHCARC